MKILTFISVTLLTVIIINDVKAQQEYVPPPLFGEPNLPPPKDPYVQKKIPKMPMVSRPAENIPEPELNDKNLINQRIIKSTPEPSRNSDKKTPIKKEAPIQETLQTPVEIDKAVLPPPVPAVKPIVKTPIKKIEVVPGPEPIDLLIKEPEPVLKTAPVKDTIKPMTIKKTPSVKGVVKGPKTMPAVKKQGVEAEVIYKPENDDTPKMIERIKTDEVELDPVVIERPSKPVVMPKEALPEIEIQKDGSQKITIKYDEGLAELGATQKAVIDQMVIPALDLNRERHVKIQSFASAPYDEMNADRRLSLSRAMKIREYLITQAISAPRIDIRSLGSQTDIQPLDRVEFYIVE